MVIIEPGALRIESCLWRQLLMWAGEREIAIKETIVLIIFLIIIKYKIIIVIIILKDDNDHKEDDHWSPAGWRSLGWWVSFAGLTPLFWSSQLSSISPLWWSSRLSRLSSLWWLSSFWSSSSLLLLPKWHWLRLIISLVITMIINIILIITTVLVIYMTNMLMILAKIDLQDFVFSTTRLSRLRRGNLEKESLPKQFKHCWYFVWHLHCVLGGYLWPWWVFMTLVSECCRRKGFLKAEAFEALGNFLLSPPHQQTWTYEWKYISLKIRWRWKALKIGPCFEIARYLLPQVWMSNALIDWWWCR